MKKTKKKAKMSFAQKTREIAYFLKCNELKLSDLEIKRKEMEIEHHQKKMHLLEDAMKNLQILMPAAYDWLLDHRIIVQPKPSADVQ